MPEGIALPNVTMPAAPYLVVLTCTRDGVYVSMARSIQRGQYIGTVPTGDAGRHCTAKDDTVQ